MLKTSLSAATALATGVALVAPVAARDLAEQETITIYGERLEESLPLALAEYGSRVELVTTTQIDEGGFVDTTAVLQNLVPGLYLAPKNGAFDYVNLSLQGSRTKDVIWLVDGVRVSNRLYDTTTPLDTLPAHMIERIEVLKGGQSLFYGTQAVAGAINIVTRDYSDETDAELTVGFDTNNGTTISGYARGAAGPGRFVVYGSADEADGFQPFRDEDYQPSSTDRERGYDVTTIGAKYGLDLTTDMFLSAQLQHTDGTAEFASAEDYYAAFNERDEDIASAKLDWTPTDRLALYVKAYWHDWDSHYTQIVNEVDADTGELTGDLRLDSDRAFWGFEDYGLNVLSEFDVNEQATVLLGYDYQTYEGRDDEFLIGEQSEDVNAVFGQVRLDLDVLEGARVAAGVRHNVPSDGQEKTVWNVSGEVDLTSQFYARGQVGTSFRLPTAYELYVVDPCCEQGNPNLVGEESFNVEAALGANYGNVTWEAVAFHRKIKDLIDIDFDLPAFPDGLIVNTDEEVEVNGGELIVSAALSRSLTATFDYTHTEAELESGGGQLQDIPEDIAKVLVDWRPEGARYGVSGNLNWVGDVFDQVGGGVGPVAHGNYATLDLSGYVFLDDDEHHRLGLRLANVLDEDYATQVRRTRLDADSSVSYGAEALGTPRTAYLTYTFQY